MKNKRNFLREKHLVAIVARKESKAAWEALMTLAIEMGFDIAKLSTLKYDHIELRNLMISTWREKVALLKQCQKAYAKQRKENDQQRQTVMAFMRGGKRS